MTADNRREMDEAKETLEQQSEVMRDFLEDKTGKPHKGGPVNEATGRIPDTQLRMKSVENRQI